MIARNKGKPTQACFGQIRVRLGNTSLQQKDQGNNATILEANLPFKMSGYTEVTLIDGLKVKAFQHGWT